MNRSADNAAPEPGISCPACGCCDLRVVYVRQRMGRTMRRRECRHCGRRVVTWERIATEKASDRP
jgi:transcriptional regulator NrdR family protein